MHAYFHLFNEVGEHDDGTHVVVPCKSPEVDDSIWQRALCSYVLVITIVALCTLDVQCTIWHL